VLKYAFIIAVAVEWLFGPAVASPLSFGLACLRTFMATLLAWMILEGVRLLVGAVMTLDDKA
jgi:hypothetical protein